MKSFLLIFLGFIFGNFFGSVAAMTLFGGVNSTAGMAAGLEAGACLAARAGADSGYLTEDEKANMLATAAGEMQSARMMEGVSITVDEVACNRAIGMFRAAPSMSDEPLFALIGMIFDSMEDPESAGK